MTEPDPTIRHVRTPTPMGDLLIAARGDGVRGVYFDAQKHFPDPEWFGTDVTGRSDDVLDQALFELEEYFAGSRQDFTVPLRPEGTGFQQRVWQCLVEIPFGSTTTYGAISGHLSPAGVATPGLAQGVGQAVGHNPVSILIPCHRVLGADGSLTGFAGGLDRKRWLLAHEEPAEIRETRLF